jgi:hypothetical protein
MEANINHMGRQLVIACIIAPFLASAAIAREAHTTGGVDPAAAPFQLDAEQLGPLQYSRIQDNGTPALRAGELQTQISFKLKANRPEFSRKGGYGLNMFNQPELAVQTGLMGPHHLQQSVLDLHSGFAYSAGVKVEHEDARINGTAYVSSSLLGLSYGRLGRLWYGGIDVNLEQFTDDPYSDGQQSDVVSLDLTTGRRLSWTGLSARSPLWLLTLQGDFDLQQSAEEQLESNSAWFLNPSLFWRHPGFTFSAEVQVPMAYEAADTTEEEPDYRLRAVFEKQF